MFFVSGGIQANFDEDVCCFKYIQIPLDLPTACLNVSVEES